VSANPQPRPLVTGDLDLLISRSLDGDLPGEEERELKSLLAADPAARARYDAMARLVGRLEEIPEPETPFALATRINSQLEDDTKGLAASLHRFGFYFRPATLGVVGAGIVAIALSYTVMSPTKPVTTVAESKARPAPAPASAPADDGRVSVFFGESEKKDSAPARVAEARPAAPAASYPAEALASDAKKGARQEPVQVASNETRRAKEEVAFAPERDAPALAAAAPAPQAAADRRDAAAESAAEGVTMQKSVVADGARLRAAPAPAAAGAVRAVPSLPAVDVVGKTAGTLRLAAPASLEGLSGPFDGSYRLELNGSGKVTEVVRLFGGSGVEPAGLQERLRALSFVPADAARSAGSVDVKVRLP
jgi:hypothetical protein